MLDDASGTPPSAEREVEREVERALNDGRPPPEFDGSGFGRQWTRSMADHDAVRP